MYPQNFVRALGLGLGLWTTATLVAPTPALPADHADGAAVVADPSTDIGDVYAWMDPAGGVINLAMTVHPAAAKTSLFSNQAYYVFHTTSRPSALVTPASAVDITCGFDNSTPQNISYPACP